MILVLLSLLSSILFSIIDSILFFIGVETIQNYINNIQNFDLIMSELLTSGITSSIAIFFSTYLRIFLTKKYKIKENPFIDFIGILLGTIIVLLIYYLYKKLIYIKKKRY